MSPFGNDNDDDGYNAFLCFLQSPNPPPPKTELKKEQQPPEKQGEQKQLLQKPMQQPTKSQPTQPLKQPQQQEEPEDDGYDEFLSFLQCPSITLPMFGSKKTTKLKEIALDNPSAVEKVLSILATNGMVMFGLSGLFLVLTAPTQTGVEKLESINLRTKDEKKFGFIVGDIRSFHNLIEKDALPPSLQNNPSMLETISAGSHMNVVINKYLNTINGSNGAIDGMVFPPGSALRNFFQQIEAGLYERNITSKDILTGKEYSATLVTSCINGNKKPIVDLDEARRFGEEKGIALIVTAASGGGLLPFIQLRSDRLMVFRQGADPSAILSRKEAKDLRVSFARPALATAGLLGESYSPTDLHAMLSTVGSDSYLDKQSLEQFLANLTYTEKASAIGKQDIRTLYDAIDYNAEGKISFSEFVSFVEHARDEEKRLQLMASANKSVKPQFSEPSSTSSKEELYKFVVLELGMLFSSLDADKSGNVGLSEMLRGGLHWK